MTTRLLKFCGYAEVSFDSAERREEILRCGVSNHGLTLLTHKTVSRRSQMCEKLGWSYGRVYHKPHEPSGTTAPVGSGDARCRCTIDQTLRPCSCGCRPPAPTPAVVNGSGHRSSRVLSLKISCYWMSGPRIGGFP